MKNKATITPGSKASFSIDLIDDQTCKPIDLSEYQSGKIIFTNSAGEKTEVSLDMTSAMIGSFSIEVSSSQTQGMDEKSRDFDLEFFDGTDYFIVPVDNSIEIVARNCP